MNDAFGTPANPDTYRLRLERMFWVGALTALVAGVVLQALLRFRGILFPGMAVLFAVYASVLHSLRSATAIRRFSKVLVCVGIAILAFAVGNVVQAGADAVGRNEMTAGAVLRLSAPGLGFIAFLVGGVFFYPAYRLRCLAGKSPASDQRPNNTDCPV